MKTDVLIIGAGAVGCALARELSKYNIQVTVLDEVNGCYVVEYEGQIGYMELDMVSQTKIVSSPNSGNTGNPDSTWTPPKL
jgi:choline dehydrogenase-like flavoprotein